MKCGVNLGQREFASDYYMICEDNLKRQNMEGATPYNLPENLIEKLGEKYSEYARNSMRDTYSDPGRLQILYEQDDGLYEIQFLRLREQIQPEIAKQNGELEVFTLEEGTYLAESASALFDPMSSVFVLQRNYFGANSLFIQAYLNNLLHDEPTDQIIQFIPMIGRCIDLRSIFSKKIKAFSGRVVFEGEPLDVNNNIANFNKFRPAVVDFSVKASRSRESQLDQLAAAEQIRIMRNDSTTKALFVKVENIDRGVDEIDLLSDRIQDKFIVNDVSRKNPARHHQIYEKLKQEYLKRVETSREAYFEERKSYILEHR